MIQQQRQGVLAPKAAGLQCPLRPVRCSRLLVPRVAAVVKSKDATRNPTPARLILKTIGDRLRHLGQGLLGAAVAGTLICSPANADNLHPLTFPIADKPELFALQKTLVEAWSIVSETFVDPSFNGQDWTSELSHYLNTVADAPSPTDAAAQITDMMGTLGDPFTRWVPPEEYHNFRVSSDGELKGGVGLLIAQDPSSGRLMVLAPIKGSPADRAGIQPGDEVVTVDGTSTAGWDGDAAARILRGEQGSSVTVEVARRQEAVPGVAGLVDPSEPDHNNKYNKVERKRFRLKRETVELSPIFATAMTYDDHTYGYIRLVTFSQHAADDMRRAVAQLKRDGAEAFVLDLRNNPGGLVTSALEVASLWLDGAEQPTIFSVQDRPAAASSAAEQQDVSLNSIGDVSGNGPHGYVDVQNVVLSGTRPATKMPLVVLVNRQSASASEILAGALHDNGRAEVIGDRTFGKGKIQSVFELSDGSALFVTVAKYRTPSGADIDQIGVLPDRACSAARPGGPTSLPGIPVGPGTDERVIEELETDDCVLTAEALLEAQADVASTLGGGKM